VGFQPSELKPFPGSEIVLEGLADLAAGRETERSEAVMMASTRLRAAGLDVPTRRGDIPAAHRLYALLADEDARNAHSRYNAVLRRVESFARAAERAQAR